MAPLPGQARYADVVATSPDTWEKRRLLGAGVSTYYPVISTGYERDWSVPANQVILNGRTPDLFEQVLIEGREFQEKHPQPFIVLGPTNEWAGSYIEPCTDFGFAMYEKVRKVFGKGNPATWPVNYGPADVGLGPYDFPEPPMTPPVWTFDDGTSQGWSTMMNLSNLHVEQGQLRAVSNTNDPAFLVATHGIYASDYTHAIIQMQLIGDLGNWPVAQLFWSNQATNMTESASGSFHLKTDGVMHIYTVDLTSNPQWRSQITSLRFDPCNTPGVEIRIDSICLTGGRDATKAWMHYR